MRLSTGTSLRPRVSGDGSSRVLLKRSTRSRRPHSNARCGGKTHASEKRSSTANAETQDISADDRNASSSVRGTSRTLRGRRSATIRSFCARLAGAGSNEFAVGVRLARDVALRRAAATETLAGHHVAATLRAVGVPVLGLQIARASARVRAAVGSARARRRERGDREQQHASQSRTGSLCH